jgi:dTDP-4-amino-4,6-dideoxygalactose transaminase
MRFAYPAIDMDAEVMAHFEKIFQTRWVSNSEYTRELEGHFTQQCGVKHAIACCNATQGLTIALSAAGWMHKRVAVPAFTWPSTVYAIVHNNCEPVFSDIDPETWALDIRSVEGKYDAVLPVDIFGNEVTVDAGGGPVIYDAAHGYGLPALGKRGLVEVVSLSHTKYPTAGEGGIILTNDDAIAETAVEQRRLAARLSEFNAIVALNSIRKYTYYRQQREEVIQRYLNEIKVPFVTQKIPVHTNNSVFAVLLEPELRDKIASSLTEDFGLEIKIYYEPIVKGLFNTDFVYKRILALPTHIRMRDMLDDVIGCINRFA